MQNDTSTRRLHMSALFMQSSDGMLDIFFGLVLVIAGVNAMMSFYDWKEAWYVRFGMLIIIVPLLLGKWFITTPRLGHIGMRPVAGGSGKVLNRFLAIGMALTFLLLVAAIFKLPGFRGHRMFYSPILEFGLLVTCMGFVSWLVGAYSIFYAGMAAGFAWPVAGMVQLTTIAGVPAEIFTLCLPGLVIFVYGLIKFVKFVKLYPLDFYISEYEIQD